jgi:hypothetical protein
VSGTAGIPVIHGREDAKRPNGGSGQRPPEPVMLSTGFAQSRTGTEAI